MTLQRSPQKYAVQAQKKLLKEKKSPVRELLRWLWALLTIAILAFLIQTYIAQLIRVDGASMEATLHHGEIVLVSKAHDWLGGNINRGDVVICRYPGRTEQEIPLSASLSLIQHTIFIKRLVAVPGDTVEVRGGVLYVNGQPADDPSTLGSTPRDFSRRTLGENEYFVMGDNRFSSHDSRSEDVGAISRDMIVGKVKWVIWPLQNIRAVE